MTVKDHHTLRDLQALARGQPDARLARRIAAVARAKRGDSAAAIAQATGDHPRTIQGWVARYNRGKIQALGDQPRSGRKPRLDKDRYPRLCTRLDAGPTEADGVASFTGSGVQRLLEKEFGVLYKLDGVYKLLHRLGYSWLMPRPRHEEADPQAQEAFKKTSARSWRTSRRTTRAGDWKSTSRTRPVSASKAR